MPGRLVLPSGTGLTAPPSSGPTFISYPDERQSYVNYARQAARKNGVPEDMFVRLINWESDFQPRARSRAGAMGIAQFMPGTARAAGLSNPWDPYKSLDASAQHLATLKKSLGSWRLAVAGYNAGAGAVIKAGYDIPKFPETQKYVQGIYRGEDTFSQTGQRGAGRLVLPSTTATIGASSIRGMAEHAARTEARGVSGAMLTPPTPAGAAATDTPSQPFADRLGRVGAALKEGYKGTISGMPGALQEIVAREPAGLKRGLLDFGEFMGTALAPFRVLPQAVGEEFLMRPLTEEAERTGRVSMPAVIAATLAQSIFDIGLDPSIVIPALRGGLAARGARTAAGAARVSEPAQVATKSAGEFYSSIRETVRAQAALRRAGERQAALQAAEKGPFTVTPSGVAVPSVAGRAMIPSGPEWVTKEFSNIGAARAFAQAKRTKGIQAEIGKRGNKILVTFRSTETEPMLPRGLLGPGAGQAPGDVTQRLVGMKGAGQAAGMPRGTMRVRPGEMQPVPGATREVIHTGLRLPTAPFAAHADLNPEPLVRAVEVIQNPTPLAQAVLQHSDEGMPDLLNVARQVPPTTRQLYNWVQALFQDEGGRVLPRGTFDMASLWVGKVGKIAKNSVKLFLSEANEVVGRMGPFGQRLVRMANAVDDEAEPLAANILEGWKVAAKAENVNLAQVVDKIRDMRDFGISHTLSPKEQSVANLIAHFLDDQALARTSEVGLPVKALESYFPRRPDWQAFKDQGKWQYIVGQVAKNRNISEAAAEDLLERYILKQRRGRPFGNLERARVLPELSKDYRKPALEELEEYVRGWSRRTTEVKVYGKQDENVDALLYMLKREGKDDRFAKAWFDLRAGKNPFSPDQMWDDFVSTINDVQVAAKLPLAVIANSTQPANNILVTNVRSFVRGYSALLKAETRGEALDFARRTGVVLDDVFTQLKRMEFGMSGEGGLGESVLTKTGFLKVEGGNRLLTAVIGREWVRDLVKGIGKSNNVRQLQRIGFTPEDISRMAREGLSVADETTAARWLVRKTQFSTSPAALPMFWSSPWGRFLTLFKRFSYKQTQLMWDSLWNEGFVQLAKGNLNGLRPLIVAGTIMPAVGETIASTRALLKEGLTSPIQALVQRDVSRMDPREIWRRAMEQRPTQRFTYIAGIPLPTWRWYSDAMAWVGGLGLASELVKAATASPGQIERAVLSFVAGPTGADVVQFGAAAITSARDIQKAGRGLLQRRAGEEPSEETKTTFMGPRTLGRIALGYFPYSQIYRTGFSEIFRSPEGLRREIKSRALEAAMNDDWDTFSRLSEQYLDKYGESISPEDIRSARKRKAKKER